MSNETNIPVNAALVLADGTHAHVVGVAGRWVKLSTGKSISRAAAFEGFARDKAEAIALNEAAEADEGEKQDTGIVPARYKARYQKVKLDSGSVSLDNGDEVAIRLRGMEIDEVYGLAAEYTGMSVKELKAKYAHLNAGQVRMNLGNRIRAVVRKGKSKSN